MKRQHSISGLLLLLPLSLAHQNPFPRVLAVKPGRLGEMGCIYARDFATPAEERGFVLLKNGSRDEARALFTEDLKTDQIGLAAVGLAQATPPDDWAGQIKDLDGQLNRRQADIRLAFRLGLLMYYDSISHSKNRAIADVSEKTEFYASANLLSDLWKRTRDPLTGMLLSEMAFRVSKNDFPRPPSILETLVGVVGGKEALNAYTQAKRTGFMSPPPAASAVPEGKRRLLVGVLTALWSNAHRVDGPTLMYNAQGKRVDAKGKLLPADKQKWTMPDTTDLQKRELAYIDAWIHLLNPNRGKSATIARKQP